MSGEFSINPKQCRAQAEQLEQVSVGLKNGISRLERAKDQLSQIRGNSYGYVSASLEQLIMQVQKEKTGVASLEKVLGDSILLYENSDRAICEQGIGKETTGIGTVIADLLQTISGWRSEPWEVMLESFLLKGLFGEDVVDSLRQIFSGTYVTSKKIDGILYLKLHQNGMTNQEIAKWLEENIGGNWDDYSARRMKDFNFGIYDYADNHFTDKMKYFREVSDGQLQSYFNMLKEKPSFETVFKSEFKLLDDFNYKGFKEATKLGKAGKVLGTLGTVLTIGGDVTDNFYNADTGTWTFSGNQVADCIWDAGVDLAAGSGCAAAGTAIGTLIAPPVGTVIGAGAGIALDYVVNNVKLWDVDGDGENDSIVDSLKICGDELVDGVEKIGGNVCDWLGDVFSF